VASSSGVSLAHPQHLASFLPAALVARLSAATDAAPLACGGVALFVDISGFTRLSEALVRAGPSGVEQVTQILNNTLGSWVDLVAEYGGETIKFAGDAILAIWSAAEGERGQAALAALTCALRIRAGAAAVSGVHPGSLRVRISLGAGSMWAQALAIGRERRDLLLFGPALRDALDAQADTSPGDIHLGAGLWPQLQGQCAVTPMPSGHARLRSLQRASEAAPRQVIAAPLSSEALRAFIPPAALARLRVGQDDWLGELRRVTVVFISLGGVDEESSGLKDMLAGISEVLERYGGGLNKLSIDDKGLSVLAAFGLPPISHPDDPARALQAVLAVQAEHDAAALRVGVATGRVFCGIVGSPRRREYTLIGDVVNLAARLMQTSGSGVLCDEPTASAAAGVVDSLALGPSPVRGRSEPLPLFRPLARRPPRSRITLEHSGRLIGHERARGRLAAALEALTQGRGGVLVLEGEAGIGKSRLARFALGSAQELGLASFTGAAEPREPAAAYHAFHDVVAGLLGVLGIVDLAERRRRVELALAEDERLLELAPLLSDVVPLGLAENSLTRQLEPTVRAENTRELLLGLLARRLGGRPALLVVEDAHWFDSASWQLARALAAAGRPVLLLLTTRPQERRPEALEVILRHPAAELVGLQGLSEAEAAELLVERTGLAEVPARLVHRLREWAQGNPFFVEQIGLALYEAGLISRDRRQRVVISASAEELDSFPLPSSIEALITSRIDRLSPSQQLVLKVASVIGRAFSLEVLVDVYPIAEERPQLAGVVDSLVALRLLAHEGGEASTYGFVHALAQQATYDLMLFEQRRQLHAAVARWFEARSYGELAPWQPILAHHFARAGAPREAIEYLERAGRLALGSSAHREAITLFKDALALAEALAPPIGRERVAGWHQSVADAHLRLAEFDACRRHYAATLRCLGYRYHPRAPGLVLSLVLQLVRQVGRRLAGGRGVVGGGGAANEAARRAAAVHQSLAEIAFFEQDTLRLMHSTFANLNYAERSGAAHEIAHAYATIGVVAGLFTLHGVARAYARWAAEVAARSGGIATMADVRLLQGVYHHTVPDRASAEQGFEEAMTLFGRLGDRVRQQTAALADVYYRLAIGDLVGLERRLEQIRAGAAESSPKIRTWYFSARVLVAALRGAPSREELDGLVAALGERLDHGDRLLGSGAAALGHLRAGDGEGAAYWAEQAARRLEGAPPTTMYTSFGIHAALEVFLALNTAPPRCASRAALLLRLLAFQNPIVGARALLARGQLAARRAPKRAPGLLVRAIARAEALGNPLVAALGRVELGLLAPAYAPLLARAAAELTAMGATAALSRLPAGAGAAGIGLSQSAGSHGELMR
jgi:class 3 adenylate cyclase